MAPQKNRSNSQALGLALEEIVRSTDWLMRALTAARKVDAPDWLIGAGAIRTAVWDRLHAYQSPTPVAGIDLGYFDPSDLSEARDDEIEGRLDEALPGVRWDAKSQAAVHLWYPNKFGLPTPPGQSGTLCKPHVHPPPQ
jgi:uncharacterized protein